MTEESFDAFFEATFPRMLARAIILCGHRQDAEDALADAYLSAFESWSRIDRPEGWVYGVLVRRNWRLAEHRRAVQPTDLDTVRSLRGAAVSGPEETASAQAILTAMAALPPRQRIVLVMQCIEGYSQDEIRRILGIRSRSTVAAHLFKARRALEKALGLLPPPTIPDNDGLIGREDGLVSAASRVDQLAAPLRAAEEWLRDAVAADSASARRVRARVATGGSASRRRRWWGRAYTRAQR